MLTPGRIILFLVSLLSLAGIILLLYVKVTGLDRDEPPPDLADLTFPTTPLDDDDNAYIWRLRALKQLQARLTSLGYDPHSRWPNPTAETFADDLPPFLDAADLPALLPLLERAHLTPDSLHPWLLAAPNPDDSPAPLAQLADLLRLNAHHHLALGDPDAALTSLLHALHHAHALRTQPSPFLAQHLARASHKRALDDLRTLVLEHPLPTASLRAALAQLLHQPLTDEHAALLLKAEFLESHRFYLQFESQGLFQQPGLHLSPVLHLIHNTRLLHKPHLTLRLRADQTRYALGHLHLSLQTLATLPKLTDELTHQLARPLKLRDPENVLGRLLLGLFTPRDHANLRRHGHDQATHALTLTTLALQLHHREHLRPAETLDALVPHFLPFVPRDPLDHAPLRYDPIHHLLWSRLADDTDQTPNLHRVTLHYPDPPHP